MNRFKDTDYLNISMRIKYIEARLMGAEDFGKLLSAKTPEDAVSVIYEHLSTDGERITSPFDFERILADDEAHTAEFLMKNAHDERLVKIFALRRDFMNIKALIKAEIRHIFPDNMLLPGGTLTVDEIKKAFTLRDKKALDGMLCNAIQEASDAYVKTGDPQRIDTVCDRICYDFMRKSADGTPFDFISDYVAEKTDITNILSLIRQKLIGKDAAFFAETVLPGGKSLTEKLLISYYTLPLSEFFAKVLSTEYRPITDGINAESIDPTALEKNADKFLCAKIKKLRRVPFGPQVVAGYVLAKEYENKNIRIAMSGILSGQSDEVIKERLRLGYE